MWARTKTVGFRPGVYCPSYEWENCGMESTRSERKDESKYEMFRVSPWFWTCSTGQAAEVWVGL